MHNSSMLRMKWFIDNYVTGINKPKIKILDVGSYDVNGSYKSLFKEDKYEYYGLDIEKGKNVDIVLKNPYCWKEIETESYDIVISGQAFEHIEFFWITMSEMTRVLKKNGLMCIIAPNGFAEHRYPVDCYRFFSDGMIALARYVSLDILHVHTNCAPSVNDIKWFSRDSADSMLIAQKKYRGRTKHVNVVSYICIPENHKKLNTGLVLYNPKRVFIHRLINKLKNIILRRTIKEIKIWK